MQASAGCRGANGSAGPFSPLEQAWLVAYLASPAGDYHSGSIITIDGGRDNWVGPWPPAAIADEAGKPPAEARRPKTG